MGCKMEVFAGALPIEAEGVIIRTSGYGAIHPLFCMAQ
jgi:hypothetical protein